MNNSKSLSEQISLKASKQMARMRLWDYCEITSPSFFIESRDHLVQLSDTLQAIYEGTLINESTGKPYRKLMINMPPRHGKSFSLTKFCEWALGVSNTNRIITISYNEKLSSRFSKAVRDNIEAVNIDGSAVCFNEIFDSKIKHGDASAQLWSLEGQFFNYLGSSFTGTVTGVGCNIGIIDDPIKNAEEAYNDRVLEGHYDFYVNTFLSRLEEGAIQIINMTRWATKDLCGRLLEEEADDWYVLKMEAKDADNNMLCDDLLSLESYNDKKGKMSPAILRANYHQEPMDIQGRLYKELKTYTELPRDDQGQLIGERKAYVDTADTGEDNLCCISYVEHDAHAYILDIFYSKEPNEKTEEPVADMMIEQNISYCKIESNNGGRAFARNIRRILEEDKNWINTTVFWFHQSQNKVARINASASNVQRRLFFPHNWENKYERFYKDLTDYSAEGKNKHDDAADTITGIVESFTTFWVG